MKFETSRTNEVLDAAIAREGANVMNLPFEVKCMSSFALLGSIVTQTRDPAIRRELIGDALRTIAVLLPEAFTTREAEYKSLQKIFFADLKDVIGG